MSILKETSMNKGYSNYKLILELALIAEIFISIKSLLADIYTNK